MLKRKKFKFIFFILMVINLTIWFSYFSFFEKDITIHFIDVGSGDGAFIRTPEGFNIVIDGGPQGKLSNYLGINYPFLGKDIDLLILSHPHEDHIIGALDILKSYKVKKVLGSGVLSQSPVYSTFLKTVKDKNIDFIVARQGQNIKFGKLNIEVLFPFEYLLNKKISNINNSSLMIKIEYENFSCLFPGDLEKDVADEILFSGIDIKSDVIKVSHQGSKNGIQNVSKFLELANPKIAIISVGENSYGHPSKETIDKLTSYSIDILRTDTKGNIVIKSDGFKYWVDD